MVLIRCELSDARSGGLSDGVVDRVVAAFGHSRLLCDQGLDVCDLRAKAREPLHVIVGTGILGIAKLVSEG